jgi:DnaJ-class molecular chaperone
MSNYKTYCHACDGSGEGYGSDSRCYHCKGKGTIEHDSDDDSDDKYDKWKDDFTEECNSEDDQLDSDND